MIQINRYIQATLVSLAAFAMASCSQDEIPAWQGEDFARIEGPAVWTLNTDSMEYSFASSPASVQTFDVEAQVVVEGKRADVERTVYLKVDKEATTADAGFYYVPESVVIPAGEGTAKFIIRLNRDAKLTQQKYYLQVSLDDSRSDLHTGVKDWGKLRIKFSDILSRPSNWGDLEEFFGASYSEVKHRFIIDTLGKGEFTYLQAGGMSWGEMWNYRLILIDALNQYQLNHHGSPLVDEYGRNVTFDN